MLVVRVISVRSTCRATSVGSVIVKENQIISTGYNGSPSGDKNCTENGYCYLNLPLCTDSKMTPSRSFYLHSPRPLSKMFKIARSIWNKERIF